MFCVLKQAMIYCSSEKIPQSMYAKEVWKILLLKMNKNRENERLLKHLFCISIDWLGFSFYMVLFSSSCGKIRHSERKAESITELTVWSGRWYRCFAIFSYCMCVCVCIDSNDSIRLKAEKFKSCFFVYILRKKKSGVGGRADELFCFNFSCIHTYSIRRVYLNIHSFFSPFRFHLFYFPIFLLPISFPLSPLPLGNFPYSFGFVSTFITDEWCDSTIKYEYYTDDCLRASHTNTSDTNGTHTQTNILNNNNNSRTNTRTHKVRDR